MVIYFLFISKLGDSRIKILLSSRILNLKWSIILITFINSLITGLLVISGSSKLIIICKYPNIAVIT